jgi:predicted tellurium resistance membrane protein TerC
MLDLLLDPHAWAALITLSALEIVLGIDNVVFISILVSRLEGKAGERVRQIGLALALIFRIALLFTLTWLMSLTQPLFDVLGRSISWHDIILIGGGLFLIAKATHEIHGEIEAHQEGVPRQPRLSGQTFTLIVLQVGLIDLIFSIDSIITAIGMVRDIRIMVAAIMIAIVVMYFSAGVVGAFISKHRTTKMLALSFLVLIGTALVADGFEFHIPRGYIYFAMAFAGAVEVANVLAASRRKRKQHLA